MKKKNVWLKLAAALTVVAMAIVSFPVVHIDRGGDVTFRKGTGLIGVTALAEEGEETVAATETEEDPQVGAEVPEAVDGEEPQVGAEAPETVDGEDPQVEAEDPETVDDEAARKAEEDEAARKAEEEEAARKAEEEARKAEEEAKKAEEEAKKAEEEAKKAEEEARKAEEEAARKAEEEEAARKAEEEARKAEEEARKAEEEAKKAEEEAKKAEEEARKADEEAKKAEEEARKAEEEKSKISTEISGTPAPELEEEPEDELDDWDEFEDELEDFTDFGEEAEFEEFSDGDAGYISEELLEQFNNPANYAQVEFSGSADIELKNKGEIHYGDEIVLQAKVRDTDLSYRLVWEANDSDDRGWYTIGRGEEFSYTLSKENVDREYRVVLFTVD